jgi:hypothetical protein
MRFAVAPADVERIKQFRLAPRDGGADVCRPTLGSSAISRSIDWLLTRVLPPSLRASSLPAAISR